MKWNSFNFLSTFRILKKSDFLLFKNRLELVFSSSSKFKNKDVSKILTLKNIQNLFLEIIEFDIPIQYIYFSFLPASLIYYNDNKFQQEASGASDSAAIILTLSHKNESKQIVLKKTKEEFYSQYQRMKQEYYSDISIIFLVYTTVWKNFEKNSTEIDDTTISLWYRKNVRYTMLII